MALKLIAPELAQDERFRARFLREPRLAASLDHPNVVPIHEAGERDGQLYLAMRYVEGSDLRTLLEREGKLAPERALAVLAQIADALDAAHRRGLVHRDVKPANVLLDEDGHAYLTDFGITKQLGGASTDTGQVVGTLDYLAPEQIRGEAGRRPHRLLRARLRALRVPRRRAALPPRDRGGDAVGAHAGGAAAAARPPGARPRARARRSPRTSDERYATCAELIEAARGRSASAPRRAARPCRGLRSFVAAAPFSPPVCWCSPARSRPRSSP